MTRTPGYPFVIGVCQYVFGGYGLYAVTLIQEILFLVSVVFFRDMCRMVVRSQRVGIAMTAIYLLLPFLTLYCQASRISTGSIAFSIIMILLWCSIRSLRFPSVKYAVVMTVLMICGIAVRPGYIYLLPLYLLFWLAVGLKNYKRYWKSVAVGCLGVFVATGAVLVYKSAIKKIYGYEGITSVTYFNNYFFARENDLLNPDYVGNDSLRIELLNILQCPAQENWRIWKEIDILNKHDSNFVEMNRVVNKSLVSQPDRCASALLRRGAKVGAYPMVEHYETFRLNQLYLVFIPRLSCVYLFLLMFVCLLLWLMIWKHRFAAVSCFLWVFIVSSHFVAIAGAQDEWGRLSQQSFPALLLLIGEVASLLAFRHDRTISRNFV